MPNRDRDRLSQAVRDLEQAEDSRLDGRLEAVGLTEPFTLSVLGRVELEDAMVLGDEVLVGQTALEKLDLLVDSQRLVPNPAHPDQPVSKVK